MLTMLPLPRSTIDGRTARQVWNAAVRSVRDDLVPLRRVDLQERPDLRPSGVVDEAVDPAEPLDHALDQPFGLRRRRPRSASKACAVGAERRGPAPAVACAASGALR